jgi:hypothetical protein
MSRFIVRTLLTRNQEPPSPTHNLAYKTLLFHSVLEPDTLERYDTFKSETAARSLAGNLYQLLHEVKGAWTDPPSYAEYAVWQVTEPASEPAFLENRRQLFQLRRRVLPNFASDWLLKSLDIEGRYMILGLFGDEDSAARLCREHPEIREFNNLHPASQYHALDITQLRVWKLE